MRRQIKKKFFGGCLCGNDRRTKKQIPRQKKTHKYKTYAGEETKCPTLVDPEYQYDPAKPAGTKGGTLYPVYRKVLEEDINKLKIQQLDFKNGKAILGEFTNIWHNDHSDGFIQG